MKQSFADQMGRKVQVIFPPRRIVSLVPSQSELLHYLELDEEVVGITKFCVHPENWFRSKQRIGGTKNIHPDKVRDLKPDLIIANKEENQKEQIEELEKEFPVWISDIKTIDDAFEMIEMIGNLTNRDKKATALSLMLKDQFSTFIEEVSGFAQKRAAYFIWKDPYMVAGNSTFIDEMLKIAGFYNIFGAFERYPQVSLDDLKANNPEVILLSSEPFPFKAKHVKTFEEACPKAKTIIVDGELFSWYGSRLLKSIPYFRSLQQQIK